MPLPPLQKITLILTAVLILLGVSLSTACAQLIYSDGTASSASPGVYSAQVGTLYSVAGNVVTLANDEVSAGTASQFSAYGQAYHTPSAQSPAFHDQLILYLYSVNSSGAPDILLKTSTLSNVTQIDTGVEVLDQYELSSFTGTLDTPFTLNPGTPYYLGLSDITPPGDPTDVFLFAEADIQKPGETEFSYNTETETFDPTPGVSLAFSLYEAAPEPSSYALGLIALGTLAFEIRRRRTLIS